MPGKILEGDKVTRKIDYKSLGQVFFESCEKYSDKICQIDSVTDKSDTYQDIKLRSIKIAKELQKRNISSQDVIAFCCQHTLNSIVPILATLYLGAKVANLDSQLSVKQSEHLISLISPKIIFVEEKSLELTEKSLSSNSNNSNVEIIVFGKSTKYEEFDNLLESQLTSDDFLLESVDLDDTAIIFFTSGTTGLPKGICHSHRSFYHIIMSSREWKGYNSEVVLCASSLYWLTGMTYLLSCFIDGGCRILTNDLTPQNVLELIEKYKVTSIFLSPSMTYRVTNLKTNKKYDTSSLLVLQSGGAYISVNQLENISKFFKHSKILLGYGMSEIGGIAGFPPEEGFEIMEKKPGSVGRLCPGITAKVVDTDSGAILGPNEEGEICAKSISLMKGYYKHDNSQVFDVDGFIKTGDRGYYDEDGYFYVVERIKEMLKYKTGHIMPSLIESVLLEHPAVKEAVVIGIRVAEEGEIPAACVVLKEGFSVTETEIADFVACRVSDRERLRGGVRFVDRLQRTPTGKPMRKEIKEAVLPSFMRSQ